MTDQDNDTPIASELDELKARADLMGVPYHPSIGLEKLREKVNAAVNSKPAGDDPVQDAAPTAVAAVATGETENQRRLRRKREASELVRIRLTCMNPNKREWEGEIFSAGNSLVGTFTKYVPFNAEDGWHVPHIILEMIRARHCQIFYTEKSRNGVNVRKGKLIKEFNIEILPPLTPAELHDLAQRQAMAKSID